VTPPRVPLAHWGLAARAADRPVAWLAGEAAPRTFADLERAVAALGARLGAHPPGRWLVHTEGAWEMAVALLAVWQHGSSALLAPNAQPQTLRTLAAEALGLIGDDPALGETALLVDTGDASSDAAPAWRELDPSRCAVELLTSGTTSARKLVPKTLRQLDEELEAQERAFGERLGAAQVVSTVTHQHLYGLLFHVLWPLSAGRVLHGHRCLHPAEIASRVEAAPGGAVLVSAPVHLQRLATHTGLARLAGRVREVFSSGGPLDPESADALERALGRAPVEVYGSTETGGIAWRRQAHAAADRLAWTALPGVSLCRAPGGTLRVWSAFACVTGPEAREEGEDGWVETADRVEMLADGRFLLRGRADRVVKIGEKSVSLPDLEADLRAHPEIDEVACLRVERRPGPRVGAVVVPSDEGRARLAREGRAALGAELAAHLGRSWDRVLVPRIWRYVDRLPRDPLGKVPVAALEALVAAPADAKATGAGRAEADAASPDSARAPAAPESIGDRSGPGWHERMLRVPAGLAHFEGHFPGHPVVPGVAQVGWVLEIVRGPLGAPAAPLRIDALKFNRVIRPGDEVRIRVDRKDAGRRFSFRIDSETQVFSSGRIVVHPDG